MARGEPSTKKVISSEAWEKRLAAVKVRKEDMNRLIMNFLVTEGYVDAARTFERESGMTPGVDLEKIQDRMEIRRALQNGNVEDAIERVNDLNPEILEEGAALAFHLQQQRLIELVRAGQLEDALQFAAEYLAPAGQEHPDFLPELERTVALLAFEDPSRSPLGDLMDLTQRHKTASELNAAILSSQCQEQEPRLLHLLKMVLWAQKQLDDKGVLYPHMVDLATAQLAPPTSEQQQQ